MKKYLKFGLVAFVFMILGFVGVKAFAESKSMNSGPGSFSSTSPMMVNIGPSGNVLMRGIVVGAPGADSIVVKSWGGSWKVVISSSTQLMSATKAIADFQDGDFVGVLGTISSDGSFAVDAKVVREWRKKSEHQKNDSDKDGIPNDQDLDDDNDGILDVNEIGKANDHDNDNISDDIDTDDDNDGILDVNEIGKSNDHDDDGILDSRDDDDDNDGILDIRDSHRDDRDNDGVDDDKDDDHGGRSGNSGSGGGN